MSNKTVSVAGVNPSSEMSLRRIAEAHEEVCHALHDVRLAARMPVAFLKVTDMTPAGMFVHAGYFIYPRFWNQGYMTEAFSKVIQFAFAESDVYRITTGCLQENAGSERVMIKCGMVKEAEHTDWEWHDGKVKTRVEYRLLRSEYSFCK